MPLLGAANPSGVGQHTCSSSCPPPQALRNRRPAVAQPMPAPISTQLPSLLLAAAWVLFPQVTAHTPVHAAELLESNLQSQGNVPSELSAAGEQQAPPLSSLLQGSNKKQIEGCTRRCVPTCIRGGEGSPGLGPISLRREIVVFKDGFRSRQYCLSECAQVCKLISDNEQQQQQPQQQPQQQQQP